MKYTTEITAKITQQYTDGVPVADIATELSTVSGEIITERSIIAKLSHLGVYKKKEYLTKRGEVPIKKAEYIDILAELLDTDGEVLESLEKVNKNVLQLIVTRLKDLTE